MKIVWQALVLFIFLTLVTGVFYPALVTGIGQLAFYDKANGSLIRVNGKIVGSELLAQKTSDPKYFWPRPSGASNLGPTSIALRDQVKNLRKILAEAHEVSPADVPAEMIANSASGLDPHISPAAAQFQIQRVARARDLGTNELVKLQALVGASIERRQLGILGEPRVNVVKLNRMLDTQFGG